MQELETDSQCDEPYHIECLNPPLKALPEGEWFCPQCEQEMADERKEEEDEYEEVERAALQDAQEVDMSSGAPSGKKGRKSGTLARRDTPVGAGAGKEEIQQVQDHANKRKSSVESDTPRKK